MYVVYAGSSPAQSTIFVTHNFNSLFSQPHSGGAKRGMV